MWEETFSDKVREWLCGVAFAIYLRLARMSKEEFWREQEESAIEHVSAADALQTVYYCKCPSCSATGLLALFIQRRTTQAVSPLLCKRRNVKEHTTFISIGKRMIPIPFRIYVAIMRLKFWHAQVKTWVLRRLGKVYDPKGK